MFLLHLLKPSRLGLVFLFCSLVMGCTPSRYQQAVDSTPVYSELIQRLPEPIPKRETLSRRGNADEYEVWGKTYQVQKNLKEYAATGTASWYGQKFHGHETSNGERFDVYQFSAAHKSLPLPSYVRVHNLANDKSIVVRVNDRGPFHGDRLIDLSYAAAVRLGFADHGTAQVKIQLIAAPITQEEFQHVQVAAFHTKLAAEKMISALQPRFTEKVYISDELRDGKVLHKVRVGPISPKRLNKVQTELKLQLSHAGLIVPQ